MKFPIPQDWDNESWCRWSICWPQSEQWEGFLRGLLTLPMRGWTWDEKTGTITDVQQIGREIFAQNIPLNGVIMACNDTELADALNNIALAISNSNSGTSQNNCCGTIENTINNSIQSTVTQPVGGNDIPVYGSQPPIGLEPGEFPPTLPDIISYKSQKCSNAHMVADGIIGTIRALGAITVFNITALTGLIVLSISPAVVFPPAAIPLAVAALITLSVAMHYLDQLADAMEADKTTLICYLFLSDNVEDAIALIADLMDILIATIGATGIIGITLKGLAMMFFNTDTLNRLFEDRAALGYADAECEACHWWTCAIGTLIDFDANTVTLEAIDPGDFDALVAIAYSDTEALVELSAEVTGWTPPSDHPEFSSSWHETEDACGAGLGFAWDNISGDPEVGPVTARTFQHRANTTFTVKYTRIIP